MRTPREQLAELLKQSREDAGCRSQGALAKKLHVSRPTISRAENPTGAIPSPDLLESWAAVTGASLDQLNELAERCRSGTPAWFMPYRQAESEATTLRSWAPMIFPGLVQTDAYAREVLGAEPVTPSRLAELVTARIERQRVLSRAFYTVVIAGEVLTRCIGSPAIMAEQCAHLVTVAEMPNVTLHIVPANTTHGSWAAIDLATREAQSTVCFSTGTDDLVTVAPDRVERAMRTYDRVLGLALPPAASLAFVRDMEAQWKAQT